MKSHFISTQKKKLEKKKRPKACEEEARDGDRVGEEAIHYKKELMHEWYGRGVLKL